MNNKSNSKLTKLSRQLRKNATRHEKHLWFDFLKYLPVTVHSQKVIGNYIVDFYIASARLVIELDGSQHWEEKNEKADIERDTNLESMGLTVLRYPNVYIDEHFDAVCDDILNHLRKSGLDI